MIQHSAKPLHFEAILGRPVWMLRALEREYMRFASAALAKSPERDLLEPYARRYRRARRQVLAALKARRECAARRGVTADLSATEGRLARVEESFSRVVATAECWTAGALLSGSAARLRLLEADLHDLQRAGDADGAADAQRELFSLRLERGEAQRRGQQLREEFGLSEAGLLTRESFLRSAEKEWERCRSCKENFGAVVFTFCVPGRESHPQPIVTRLLGYAQVEVARFASSPGDLVGDLGNDAVILATPAHTVRALAELAERFRRALEATPFAQGSLTFKVEVAAGVSSLLATEGLAVERVLDAAADASRASWSVAGRRTVVELEGELHAVEIADAADDEPAPAVPSTATITLGDRVRAALARKVASS